MKTIINIILLFFCVTMSAQVKPVIPERTLINCDNIKQQLTKGLENNTVYLFINSGAMLPRTKPQAEAESVFLQKFKHIELKQSGGAPFPCGKLYIEEDYIQQRNTLLDKKYGNQWREEIPKHWVKYFFSGFYASAAQQLVDKLTELSYLKNSKGLKLNPFAEGYAATIYDFDFNRGNIFWGGDGRVIISDSYTTKPNPEYIENCRSSKLKHCPKKYLLKKEKPNAYYLDIWFYGKDGMHAKSYFPNLEIYNMAICIEKVLLPDNVQTFAKDLDTILEELKVTYKTPRAINLSQQELVGQWTSKNKTEDFWNVFNLGALTITSNKEATLQQVMTESPYAYILNGKVENNQLIFDLEVYSYFNEEKLEGKDSARFQINKIDNNNLSITNLKTNETIEYERE